MSNLVLFEHLIPFELNLNEASEEERERIFTIYYHYGAQIYECLHMIAIYEDDNDEEEEEGFSSVSVEAVLKRLKLEHIQNPDCPFPPVSDLLDIIEHRKLADTQVLFRISDHLDSLNIVREKNVPFNSTDPKMVSLDLAVDAITSAATMALHFLATSFAENEMKTANPDGYDEVTSEDEGDDNENIAGERAISKEENAIHFRDLSPIEPIIFQQNATLLLACRVGIVPLIDLCHKAGKLSFEGRLSKITPLMEASAATCHHVVSRLLEYGADPNVQSLFNGNTAIIYACANDAIDVLQVLLDTKGPIKPDVYLMNNFCHDGMMEAALVNNVIAIEEFLLRGYRPLFLHIKEDMRQESALTLAAYKGHVAIVTAILEFHDKNPVKEEDELKELSLEMYSALMEAAMDGHIEVCRLMLNRGTPTDMTNPYSVESPLSLACSGGYPEVVDVLLASGAKVEELNEEKNTPLMEACREGHADVVKVLLSRGADVNATNPDLGDTPCSLAAGGGHISILKMLMEKGGDLAGGQTSPIVEAAQEGQVETVQFILAHCRTVPQDQLSRALVVAAERGSFPIVLELVRSGADLNFEQEDRTALMRAAKGDHFEIVQLLVTKGASINYKSSKNDATALLLACSEGNTDIAQFLIRNGADPMLKMDDGVNCFMEVARHGSCDLMNVLVEFTKGNMPIDKDPPKLGISKCKANKFKKRKGMPLTKLQASDMMMMLNGIYPSKRKVCKHGSFHDMPYSSHEIDMLSHLLKLQEQMEEYEAPKDTDEEMNEVTEALKALESAYGKKEDGKINFPAQPSQYDMDKLRAGELVPSIRQWAELVSHGWLEMERVVGKPIELSSFLGYSDVQSSNAAAAVSAAAAAASGMDSQSYLASVFAKMNNGEEMPRVPATVGSLNAASAAVTGISLHSDDAMRLFGGASFATKMLSDRKPCSHSQYAAVHPVHEAAFRAALMRMGCSHKDRKGAAINIRDMKSTFPIEEQRQRTPSKTTANLVSKCHTSLTVAKSAEDGSAITPTKIYPGMLKMASDMEKAWRANQSDANFNAAVLTAYIASTIPRLGEAKIESPDSILRRLFAGKSEKQVSASLDIVKETVTNEGSDALKRSIESLSDQDLKNKYLNIFRDTSECSLYDQCVREKNLQLKAVEKKSKSTTAPLGGLAPQTSVPKSPMAKSVASQQQGQLRRTHSEGDGAERAKTRSNAIDKATESTLETPLTIACANGHKEIVELLLKEGANIEHRDKKGFSPLIIASTAGHAAVVEILLKHHAAVEAQSDRTKDTALSLACSGGRKDVVELLLAAGANKEHRNVSDYTPLSLASSGGYLEIVNMLINAGSEINSRTGSKLGISPLMLAAMNGHRDATRVLLEKGSDINAQIETNRNTALTLASFQGRTEVVKLLLSYHPNVEHRAKTGLTPLMECANGGYVDVGTMLVEAGADPNATPVPSSKDTALTIAADKGHEKFVRFLLDNDAVIDARNKKGCTALWLACCGGHADTVKTLLEKKADPDSVDNRKVSPMMAALRKGNVEIVKILVQEAKQFPNEQDLSRTQQSAETDELRQKCDECVELINAAKQAQDDKSRQTTESFLQSLEAEEARKAQKNAKKAEKKREKRDKKKSAKAAKVEAAAPSPEPQPVPVATPAPAPAIEEPPKEPSKPRRNRKKTNPNGLPKESKVVNPEPAKVEEEEETSEVPFKPIVVNIPPPAQSHPAAMLSPGSHSESEEWCKAGKEGKKTKPLGKKFGSQHVQIGLQHAKESSTTSSVTSEQPTFGIDTKNRKHFCFMLNGGVMARIIGRSGSNIKAVREVTMATIEIDKQGATKEAERKISIHGTPEAVQRAASIISLLISDSEILITDAIRCVLQGHASVASSVSSEGNSRSAADSASHISSSTPSSIPFAANLNSKRRSQSPAIQQERSSKNHQQGQKDQSAPGSNVWQQRMAARQEKVDPPQVVQKSQVQALKPQHVQPQPVVRIAQPNKEPVRQLPPTVQAPIEGVSNYGQQKQQITSAVDRVIAPPTRPIAAAVQPVQQIRPDPVQPELIQRPNMQPIGTPGRTAILRPPPPSVLQQPIQQPLAAFSKAPGTRPHQASIGANSSNPLRNELFEEPTSFEQFRSASISALGPPSTSSFSVPVEDRNGVIPDFDLSKYKIEDSVKIGDIWGKSDEGSSWLFSQFFSQPKPTNSSGLNNDPSTDDFMNHLLTNPSASSANSHSASALSNAAKQALETRGWCATGSAATFRDPNPNPNPKRSQPPLFARSPSTSSTTNITSAVLQQQQQQLQQLQQQQVLQQQQRLQQLQQQYQQHSPQSNASLMFQQQSQQIYNQMGGMNTDHYSQLAAQLLSHQEGSTSLPSAQATSMANSYYQSPSYTDPSSVLGQLNMSTITQRGIKQFDGFNDTPSDNNVSVIQALLEQQKKNTSESSIQQQQQQQSYMHPHLQQAPFGTTTNNVANQQSRLGMMQSRQQPPPFGAPQAPPGFGNLPGPSPSTAPVSSSSRQPLYQSFAQAQTQQQQTQSQQQQQQMSFHQMQQQMVDWSRQMGGQQPPQHQNQQPPQQSSKNWGNWP
uniref:ANK_REP_REGION domain-containing protein n=1 Tax=Caenorhabditis japonica TaxID=281687 RepID=A0A8R1DG54_CAEJA